MHANSTSPAVDLEDDSTSSSSHFYAVPDDGVVRDGRYSRNQISLTEVPAYISANPTCCIFFFNEHAARPDEARTAFNHNAAQVILYESIPWTTVELKVVAHC